MATATPPARRPGGGRPLPDRNGSSSSSSTLRAGNPPQIHIPEGNVRESSSLNLHPPRISTSSYVIMRCRTE